MNRAGDAPLQDEASGTKIETEKDSEELKEETPEEYVDPTQILQQFTSQNISVGDLRTAVTVMEAIATLNPKKRKHAQNPSIDGLEQYRQPIFRPFRKALANCMDLHRQLMFEGTSEEEYYEKRMAERTLKRQKMSEKALQKKYIASTVLRKGRTEKLKQLQQDAKEEEESRLILMSLMVPDGHVDTQKQRMMIDNGILQDESKSKIDEEGDTGVKLPQLRSCYVCKVRYRDLHHFYDQLCPPCAALNWTKRHQTADLSGKVALVTGSRVKIGYQTCLKLLRAGCYVIATTRFPNSAAKSYQAEADFPLWKDRLQIYGLDLRDVTGLEAFTRFLKSNYSSGIDILINNACQTVRRPSAYYKPMLEAEQVLWKHSDSNHKGLLNGCIDFERLRRRIVLEHHSSGACPGQIENENQEDTPLIQMNLDGKVQERNDDDDAPSSVTVSTPEQHDSQKRELGTGTELIISSKIQGGTSPFERTGVSHSTAMTQIAILPEDVGISSVSLPPGLSDINGQQLDLRTTNSWLLKMDEVSTPEMMECMFINAIAPFVLNSRLKPLMTHPQDDSRPDRYTINVSAMEGKFYRYKMPNHPHTNMAKAALNMLTRTASEDLAKNHRIYMNSVDTGWINDENPLERAKKTAKTNLFQTPIDEIDAAARILDPIFSGVADEQSRKAFGKFFKDYKESEW